MPDKALTVKRIAAMPRRSWRSIWINRKSKALAGFTVQCQPQGKPAYYIQNFRSFKLQVSTHKTRKSQPIPASTRRSTNSAGSMFQVLYIKGWSPRWGNTPTR